jgi:hypothetical protein
LTGGAQDEHAPPPTVRAFLADAFRRFAAADSRTLRSFRDLVRQPGLLTREYMAGRGGKYVNPIEIFLLANLLFFVVGGVTRNHMLTTNLNSQLCCQVHSDIAKHKFFRLVNEMKEGSWKDATRDSISETSVAGTRKLYAAPPGELARFHTQYRIILQGGLARFATRFDDMSEQYARTLVIILVPMLALVLAVLEFRRGSGVQHIVFALHFYAFALTFYVVSWVVVSAVTVPLGVEVPDSWWGAGLLVAQTGYLIISLGRAYGDGRVARILRGVAAGYASILALQVYRLVLFMVAFYTA